MGKFNCFFCTVNYGARTIPVSYSSSFLEILNLESLALAKNEDDLLEIRISEDIFSEFIKQNLDIPKKYGVKSYHEWAKIQDKNGKLMLVEKILSSNNWYLFNYQINTYIYYELRYNPSDKEFYLINVDTKVERITFWSYFFYSTVKKEIKKAIKSNHLDKIKLQGLRSNIETIVKQLGYSGIDAYEAYFDKSEQILYASKYSDAVFLFKKHGYSPIEYSGNIEDKYMAHYNWAFEDEDNDGMNNMKDPCPYLRGADCDIDKDLLRDDFDDRLYNVGYVDPKAHENVIYSYDSYVKDSSGMTRRSHKEHVLYGETRDIFASGEFKDYWTAGGDSENLAATNLSTYYCFCGQNNFEHRECNSNTGICGVSHAKPEQAFNQRFGKNTWLPINSMPNEPLKEENKFAYRDDDCHNRETRSYVFEKERTWNWKTDVQSFYPGEEIEFDTYETEEAMTEAVDTGLYYGSRVSSGHVKTYYHGGYTEGEGVNKIVKKDFFQPYYVSHSDTLNKLFANFIDDSFASSPTETIQLVQWYGEKDVITYEEHFKHYNFKWLDELLKNAGYNPEMIDPENPMPWEIPSDKAYITELMGNSVKITEVKAAENIQQIITAEEYAEYYTKNDDTFFIENMYGRKYEIQNGKDHKFGSFLKSGTDYYVLGNMQFNVIDQPVSGSGIINCYSSNIFGKITLTKDGYVYNTLPSLPEERSANVKLFAKKAELFAVAVTGSVMKIYRYYEENDPYWEKVSETTINGAISLGSLTGFKDITLFTAANENGTTLYSIENDNIPAEYIYLDDEPLYKTKIFTTLNDFSVVTTDGYHLGTAVMYKIVEGEVEKSEIVVKGVNFNINNQ